MARLRYRLAVLFVALLGLTVISAPAAQAADLIVPFNHWKVSGTLGVKKLNQNIPLPAGSEFTGQANLTKKELTGHTTIPDFDATIRVLGIPQKVSLSITEAGPTSGTVEYLDGNIVTNASAKAIMRIKKLGVGPLSIPPGANCRTSSPVVLPLHNVSPFPLDVSKGLNFSGTYTIPNLTGCGLFTPLLNTLMAGPNNPFALNMKPPFVQ
jgi:hypothetical protein